MINSATNGCINYHPAPLPDYKGRAGCSYAILDHRTEWGCTVHYIDTGIDTGPIISVSRFPINWKEETGFSLKKKTVMMLKELYKDVMSKVLIGQKVPSIPQPSDTGRYISKVDMLNEMEIKSGDDVDAKIQAFWFPPHEGAYILLNGKKYTLVNGVILQQFKEAVD